MEYMSSDGLYYGLGRTKTGAWMPRTVGAVLAHRAWVTEPKACSTFIT